MPPLRDAVGFVHCEQGDTKLSERLLKSLVVEAFGSDEEELDRFRAKLRHHLSIFARGETGVEPRGRNAARCEVVQLVLHQGDERRDHQREPIEHQGRKLIAQRLARTGRKNRRGRMPGDEMGDDRFLPGKERVETEPLFKNRLCVVHESVFYLDAERMHNCYRNSACFPKLSDPRCQKAV